MEEKSYNVIGVMSGTSLDGVDLAHVQLAFYEGKIQYTICHAETVPYTEEWVNALKEAVHFNEEALIRLDREYTQLLAGVINGFIERHSLTGIEAVCSHGHTVLHQPQAGFTLQIGNLESLAQMIGVTVVCNFRIADVHLGGQGAPLVPVGDRMLFANYDYCLNLGGFSNISFEEAGQRIAFDISPVNTVLNHYAARLGYPYDDGGQLAANGHCSAELLRELNMLEYYAAPYPKSLGIEFVAQTVLPVIERYALDEAGVLRTFSEHIAQQTARVLVNKKGTMLVTGGGAYNDFVIAQMRKLLPNIALVIPDDMTIQYKEALVFALLGVLRLRNENNVLSSVTGAAHDHCSGVIYTP